MHTFYLIGGRAFFYTQTIDPLFKGIVNVSLSALPNNAAVIL